MTVVFTTRPLIWSVERAGLQLAKQKTKHSRTKKCYMILGQRFLRVVSTFENTALTGYRNRAYPSHLPSIHCLVKTVMG